MLKNLIIIILAVSCAVCEELKNEVNNQIYKNSNEAYEYEINGDVSEHYWKCIGRLEILTSIRKKLSGK